MKIKTKCITITSLMLIGLMGVWNCGSSSQGPIVEKNALSTQKSHTKAPQCDFTIHATAGVFNLDEPLRNALNEAAQYPHLHSVICLHPDRHTIKFIHNEPFTIGSSVTIQPSERGDNIIFDALGRQVFQGDHLYDHNITIKDITFSNLRSASVFDANSIYGSLLNVKSIGEILLDGVIVENSHGSTIAVIDETFTAPYTNSMLKNITIKDSIFRNVSGGYGSVVRADIIQPDYQPASIVIDNSLFHSIGNDPTHLLFPGSLIWMRGDRDLSIQIKHSVIRNSMLNGPGAIALYQEEGESDILIKSSIVANNEFQHVVYGFTRPNPGNAIPDSAMNVAVESSTVIGNTMDGVVWTKMSAPWNTPGSYNDSSTVRMRRNLMSNNVSSNNSYGKPRLCVESCTVTGAFVDQFNRFNNFFVPDLQIHETSQFQPMAIDISAFTAGSCGSRTLADGSCLPALFSQDSFTNLSSISHPDACNAHHDLYAEPRNGPICDAGAL